MYANTVPLYAMTFWWLFAMPQYLRASNHSPTRHSNPTPLRAPKIGAILTYGVCWLRSRSITGGAVECQTVGPPPIQCSALY